MLGQGAKFVWLPLAMASRPRRLHASTNPCRGANRPVAYHSMPQTHLILLWHMHQPFYKDLAEGVYTMPWVRLHALKDYYGMAAMLTDLPSVRVTFNLVPSLILQVEEYGLVLARQP